jgi:hypothetical protein
MKNKIKRRNSKRGVSIMQKYGGRTGQKLNIRLKGSLRNCRMRIHIHDFDLDPLEVQ